MRVDEFRRGGAVEGLAASDGVFKPVLRVDEMDVISRMENPAKTRLPSENTAYRIVLNVVDKRDPGTELGIGIETQDAGGELSLRKLDAVPLIVQVDEDTRHWPDAEIEDELPAVSRVKGSILICCADGKRTAVRRCNIHAVASEIVLTPGRERDSL